MRKTILFPVEATRLIGTLGGIGELARDALGVTAISPSSPALAAARTAARPIRGGIMTFSSACGWSHGAMWLPAALVLAHRGTDRPGPLTDLPRGWRSSGLASRCSRSWAAGAGPACAKLFALFTAAAVGSAGVGIVERGSDRGSAVATTARQPDRYDG